MKEIIESHGPGITWEFLNADGVWYVWASHNQYEEYGFKFNESGETLEEAVKKMSFLIKEYGPEWANE